MILEHAVLHVRGEATGAFEASLGDALALIEGAPGCHGAEIRREEEDPTVYLLLVRWTSIDDHLAFRASERFAPWRALTSVHYAEAPHVTHFHEPLAQPLA